MTTNQQTITEMISQIVVTMSPVELAQYFIIGIIVAAQLIIFRRGLRNNSNDDSIIEEDTERKKRKMDNEIDNNDDDVIYINENLNNICPISISFDNDLSFLKQIKKGDIVFNALHGGSGENGDIQSILELNNIIYTGSNSKASKICMDKHVSKLVVQSEGITTPDWILYKNNKFSKQKLFKANNHRY